MPDEQVAASSTADKFYKPEAESAPATDETPAVTSESAPDTSEEAKPSETASGSEPEKVKESHSPKAETRIKQLLAKNAELEREMAELKKPSPKVEKLTPPDMPDANKFETLEALRVADAEYYTKKAAYEVQQALEKDRAERSKQLEQAKIAEYNANIEKV